MLFGAALWCSAGCRSGPATITAEPPRPVQRIDVLSLEISPPTPINWDNIPGPDGIQVKLTCWRTDTPLPVTIDGNVEFLLFQGVVTSAGVASSTPMQVWMFTGKQLNARLIRTMFGWSYLVPLEWGRQAPGAGTITLAARYSSPDGKIVSSASVSVPMPQQ